MEGKRSGGKEGEEEGREGREEDLLDGRGQMVRRVEM